MLGPMSLVAANRKTVYLQRYTCLRAMHPLAAGPLSSGMSDQNRKDNLTNDLVGSTAVPSSGVAPLAQGSMVLILLSRVT